MRRMAGSPAPSAVVTGAARGFGKEIARRLVARGHRVLITDVDAGAVAAAAAQLGAGCTGIVATPARPPTTGAPPAPPPSWDRSRRG